MTLAEQVLQKVRGELAKSKAKPFESYYYDLKQMVKESTLLEFGSVIYYHRDYLKNCNFNNRKVNSPWTVYTSYTSQYGFCIHLHLRY